MNELRKIAKLNGSDKKIEHITMTEEPLSAEKVGDFRSSYLKVSSGTSTLTFGQGSRLSNRSITSLVSAGSSMSHHSAGELARR